MNFFVYLNLWILSYQMIQWYEILAEFVGFTIRSGCYLKFVGSLHFLWRQWSQDRVQKWWTRAWKMYMVSWRWQKEVNLTLCILGNFTWFFVICWFVIKSTILEYSLGNTTRVSNSLDPDQAQHFIGPDLGLPRVSVDDHSMQREPRKCTCLYMHTLRYLSDVNTMI